MNHEYMIIGIIIGLMIALLLSKLADVIEAHIWNEVIEPIDEYERAINAPCAGMHMCEGRGFVIDDPKCMECHEDAHQALAEYNELTCIQAPYEPNTPLSRILKDMWSRDFSMEQIQAELNAMGYDVPEPLVKEYFLRLHHEMLCFIEAEVQGVPV